MINLYGEGKGQGRHDVLKKAAVLNRMQFVFDFLTGSHDDKKERTLTVFKTSACTCGKITFLRQQLTGCYYHVNTRFLRLNERFVTKVQSYLTLQKQA